MTTSLFPFTSLFPALQNNGSIAASAKLAFYMTGTTTLATVYDSDGDPISQSPNVNGVKGVEADAFARFPNIYCDDSVTYRVRLCTKLGAQIGHDIDPYQDGVGDTGGASRVGYNKAGYVQSDLSTVQKALDSLVSGVIAYDPATGGTSTGVKYGPDPHNARLFLIPWDTTPQNDTNNYFAGVVAFLGRQPRPEDVGQNSLVVGRNCYVVNPASTGIAFGHDTLNVATAACIGGAGSVVGNPNDIVGNLTTKSGYCSILWGKNSECLGQTAVTFGESCKGNTRGAFVCGFQTIAEDTAMIGTAAIGSYITIKNGGGSTDLPTNGMQFGLGAMLNVDGLGKMLIGSGVNPGARMINDIPGSLQIGAKALRGTTVHLNGVVGESYNGRFYSRVGFRALGDGASGTNGIDGLGAATNEEWGGWMHQLDGNTGGDTTTATIDLRTLGTVASVIKIRHDFMIPVTDNAVALGGASSRYTTVYAATGTINTSDETTKQDIGAIPDAWLDAWGDVDWCRFRFKDAVSGKGDDARWHMGLVAQRVRDVFTAHNIDAQEIGLLCYDEWPEEREEVIVPDAPPTGETRVTREAGSVWGLRYEECFAIEAAWQRRRMDQIEARLA